MNINGPNEIMNINHKLVRTCLNCGKKIYSRFKKVKFCSQKCAANYPPNIEKRRKRMLKFRHTVQSREKIRIANLGKNNYRWQGGFVERKCLKCGVSFKIEISEYNRGGGKFCSPRCYQEFPKSIKTRKKMGKSHLGEKSNFYKGGVSDEYRMKKYSCEWDMVRHECYRRDDYECQMCEKKHTIFDAHHIIPYRISFDHSINNLITLCRSCHMKVEWMIKDIYGRKSYDNFLGFGRRIA